MPTLPNSLRIRALLRKTHSVSVGNTPIPVGRVSFLPETSRFRRNLSRFCRKQTGSSRTQFFSAGIKPVPAGRVPLLPETSRFQKNLSRFCRKRTDSGRNQSAAAGIRAGFAGAGTEKSESDRGRRYQVRCGAIWVTVWRIGFIANSSDHVSSFRRAVRRNSEVFRQTVGGRVGIQFSAMPRLFTVTEMPVATRQASFAWRMRVQTVPPPQIGMDEPVRLVSTFRRE